MLGGRHDRNRHSETVFLLSRFKTHGEMTAFSRADWTSGVRCRVPDLAQELLKLVQKGASHRFPHDRNRTVCRSRGAAGSQHDSAKSRLICDVNLLAALSRFSPTSCP